MESFISFKLEVCVMISMMPTFLSTAPYLIGRSNYWTEQNPHRILRAQESQVSDKWKGINLKSVFVGIKPMAHLICPFSYLTSKPWEIHWSCLIEFFPLQVMMQNRWCTVCFLGIFSLCSLFILSSDVEFLFLCKMVVCLIPMEMYSTVSLVSVGRSWPPGGPAINRRDTFFSGGTNTFWNADAALLRNSAPLLGGGAAGTATKAASTTPSPAAPWRRSTTHTHLETTERQVHSHTIPPPKKKNF